MTIMSNQGRQIILTGNQSSFYWQASTARWLWGYYRACALQPKSQNTCRKRHKIQWRCLDKSSLHLGLYKDHKPLLPPHEQAVRQDLPLVPGDARHHSSQSQLKWSSARQEHMELLSFVHGAPSQEATSLSDELARVLVSDDLKLRCHPCVERF